MVHIHKKLLSKADILMINRSLSVTVSNDYGPDKNYRLYEMSGDYYQVPLFWAYKNLSAPFDINFNKDIDIKPGKLKAIPRSCQKECMKLCKVELQKPWGGGIINISTGGGKSIMSMMIICEVKKKTLIVVHTIELLQQWTKSLSQFLPSCRVGYIQGKKFDVDGFDIVIGMLQTISMKCELNAECFSSFGLVIYDEVQFLGAEVFSKALLKSRARYTFGLSATIERADGLEYVFKNHIGDVIYSNISGNLKQYTEMKYVYVNCGLKEIAMYNGSPNIAGMITEMTGDKRRTTQIVNEILHLDVKRNVLVLSDRVQHLKDMYKMIGPEHCGLYIGEMKEDDKLLSKTKRILLATYHIASVGFDLPKLNTLVFATPRSSITQAIGRIYRKVHEDINPMIIDFIDTYSVFPYQFKKRKKIYSKAITLVSSDECCMFE